MILMTMANLRNKLRIPTNLSWHLKVRQGHNRFSSQWEIDFLQDKMLLDQAGEVQEIPRQNFSNKCSKLAMNLITDLVVLFQLIKRDQRLYFHLYKVLKFQGCQIVMAQAV